MRKIGSIAPTRSFISNISKFFGAITVSVGNDDSVEYVGCDMKNSHFDLSLYSGYHYTEFTHFNYSNGALINAGISNANIGTATNTLHTLPYNFAEFGGEKILGSLQAKSIILPYSQGSETELYYSEAEMKYTFAKAGTVKNDMLNDSKVCFDNVFVLFADTVTYESDEASEMVMDTLNEGDGYYITYGTAIKIKWQANETGNLIFMTEDGKALTVNRGTSYIGYVKSSLKNSVKIN